MLLSCLRLESGNFVNVGVPSAAEVTKQLKEIASRSELFWVRDGEQWRRSGELVQLEVTRVIERPLSLSFEDLGDYLMLVDEAKRMRR